MGRSKTMKAIIAAILCAAIFFTETNIFQILQISVYGSTRKTIKEWFWSEQNDRLYWSTEKERWEIYISEISDFNNLESWLPSSIDAVLDINVNISTPSIAKKDYDVATPSVSKPSSATSNNAEETTDDNLSSQDIPNKLPEDDQKQIAIKWHLENVQQLFLEEIMEFDTFGGHKSATNSSADAYREEITVSAELPSLYRMNSELEPVEITLVFAIEPRIISQEVLDANLVETVSPENILINVFDYWITGEEDSDVVSKDEEYQTLNDGINKDHPMIFKYNMPNGIQLGYWNNWTKTTGGSQVNIVKNKLENGYPILNLTSQDIDKVPELKGRGDKANESLDYLFDPDFEQEGKRVYRNITGLFYENDAHLVYDASQSFSELVKETKEDSDGYFRVYNAPAVRGAGNDSADTGQFFPMNNAQQVFIEQDGNLVPNSQVNARTEFINHYFGLTMEVDFQQPDNGIIDNNGTEESMEWYFSGDDDVWVFIDDVLIADVGGIHDELYAEIDFVTGKVIIDRVHNPNANTRIEKTLKQCFEEANMDTSAFNGDTFANRSNHTMKMFYLERGNNGSHMHLSFNLLENNGHTLEKQDQDGNLIPGALFDLYAAVVNDGKYEIDPENPDPLLQDLTTNNFEGMGINTDDNNFDFSQYDHYILRETKTPEGYRSIPDIWLDYRHDIIEEMEAFEKSAILTVENPFTTGVSVNHIIEIYQSDLNIVDQDMDTIMDVLDKDTIARGLLFAIPTINTNEHTSLPLYGSTKEGFHFIKESDHTAILAAILCQIFGNADQDLQFPLWNLHWEASKSAFHEMLFDLPYEIDQYNWKQEEEGKLSLRMYFVDMQGINGLDQVLTEAERINVLLSMMKERVPNNPSMQDIINTAHEVAEVILSGNPYAIKQLDMETSSKSVYAKIEIPNAARMLVVKKVNEVGMPLSRAEFGIFTTYEDAAQETDCIVSGTTGVDGTVLFAPASMKTGVAINFEPKENGDPTLLYLKELSAPNGYLNNKGIVPVLVTPNGVYADAGTTDDGIKTMISSGKLMATMRHYAADPALNNTLSKVITEKLTKDSPDAKWEEAGVGSTTSMHYESGMMNSYATNDGTPYMYQTDTGYLNFEVKQAEANINTNQPVMTQIELSDLELSGLLAPITTVEVTNIASGATLTINKRVDKIHDSYGNPFFLFKITSDDGSVLYKWLEIPNGQLQRSIQFNILGGHTYTIEEIDVSRYKLSNITAIKNAEVFEDYAIADMTDSDHAEITFENIMTQYEKFSHTVSAVNQVSY